MWTTVFGIDLRIKYKNIEDSTEVKIKREVVYKLICYLDISTLELVEGLKKSLKENIDLFSDKLQRNTVFEKSKLNFLNKNHFFLQKNK